MQLRSYLDAFVSFLDRRSFLFERRSSFQDQILFHLHRHFDEDYRFHFARFYFLSNEDLVDLMASRLDPRSYLRFIRQLFSGIHRLDFQLPETISAHITSPTVLSATIDIAREHLGHLSLLMLRNTLCSACLAHRLQVRLLFNEHEEPLRLMSPVRSNLSSMNTTSVDGHAIDSQQLVHWFQSLETSMKHALENSIFSLFDARIDEHVERCLGIAKSQLHTRGETDEHRHPVQSIVIVEHILFERRLQKLIDGSSKAPLRREQ